MSYLELSNDNENYVEYLPLSEEEVLEKAKVLAYSDPQLQTFFQSRKRNVEGMRLPPLETATATEKAKDCIIELEQANEYGVRLLLDASEDSYGIGDSYLLPARNPFLVDWLDEQARYSEKVGPKGRHAIRAYTHHGDFLVNAFLRGIIPDDVEYLLDELMRKREDNPLIYAIEENYEYLRKRGLKLPYREELWVLPQNTINWEKVNEIIRENMKFFSVLKNIEPLIISFIGEIARTIYSSPRPKGILRVYRGVATEHLEVKDKTIDFWSTSLNPMTSFIFAENYLRDQLHGLLYEIEIPPNVPCMFIQNFTQFEMNYEVLFPPGLSLRIRPQVQMKRVIFADSVDEFCMKAVVPKEIKYVLSSPMIVDGWTSKVPTLESIHEDWTALRRWSRERKMRRTRKLETLRLGTRTLVPKTKTGTVVKSRWRNNRNNSSTDSRNRRLSKQRSLARKTRRKVKFELNNN